MELSHHSNLEEKKRNYNDLYTNLELTRKTINDSLKSNALVKALDKDCRDSRLRLNPAKLLTKSRGRGEILIHWTGNACFTRPNCVLDNVLLEAETLARCDRVSKSDLRHRLCFAFESVSFLILK